MRRSWHLVVEELVAEALDPSLDLFRLALVVRHFAQVVVHRLLYLLAKSLVAEDLLVG